VTPQKKGLRRGGNIAEQGLFPIKAIPLEREICPQCYKMVSPCVHTEGVVYELKSVAKIPVMYCLHFGHIYKH
jgi:hypothetical protein